MTIKLMLNKYCFLLPLLFIFLLPVPLMAKASDFTLKVESTSSSSISINEDIEKAFNQLQQTLTKNEESPIQTYAQIAGTIEQYQYIEESSKQWLFITFNEKATLAYLKQKHLLTMSTTNPITIVYVAQKVGFTKTLLDIETSPDVLNTIIQQAGNAGLVLIAPAMDLNDIETLNFDDVWQQNMTSLKRSASRYQASGILLVKLQRVDGDNWQSSWHLYQNDALIETSIRAAAISKLTQQAISYFNASKEKISLTTQNIRIQTTLSNSQNDYQKTLLSIKKIAGVLDVQLDGVTQGSVFYTLSINTDKNELIRKLKGHKKIIHVRVMP